MGTLPRGVQASVQRQKGNGVLKGMCPLVDPGMTGSQGSGVAKGRGGAGPPMAGQKKIKIDISDFEVLCGLSSPKSPDISTSLRLSTFEHHLLLLPVADFDDITVMDRIDNLKYCTFLL